MKPVSKAESHIVNEFIDRCEFSRKNTSAKLMRYMKKSGHKAVRRYYKWVTRNET